MKLPPHVVVLWHLSTPSSYRWKLPPPAKKDESPRLRSHHRDRLDARLARLATPTTEDT